METLYGQMPALRLGDRDEHHALELDTTELNVKGKLYLRFVEPELLLAFILCYCS